MRVLSIAHNAVASSNRRRFEALAALPGVTAELLTPRWWHEEGARITVPPTARWRVGRTLATGNGTRYLYVDQLVAALRSVQPDVIDLMEEPFSAIALQSLLVRELWAPRAALVFYSAVNVARTWRLPYRLIERLVLRRADGAHAPNQDVPRILHARGLRAPVATIPLGVDRERFASATPMPLACPAPRVGFIGRIEPVKGLDVLLEAFARLQQLASLVIAGDGPDWSRLASRARSASIAKLPSVPFAEVPHLLRALDVLVLPSVTILPLHREQFGRVLVEAMAAGVPVIGSSSGAIPEVIGDAGLVVPERDPAALAAAIDRVLADPGLRQQLIARGHARVAQRFDWSVIAEQTVHLFHLAVQHRRGAERQLQEVRV